MGEVLNSEEKFEYEYSAKKQAQVEAIRKKYVPHEEDKLEKLKRLDQSAEKTGTAHALAVGIPGALIFGGGMSLVMTDIAETVGIQNPMLYGIIIGIVGMFMAIINYPIYKAILGSRRKKYAEKIIVLSDKIMNK